MESLILSLHFGKSTSQDKYPYCKFADIIKILFILYLFDVYMKVQADNAFIYLLHEIFSNN